MSLDLWTLIQNASLEAKLCPHAASALQIKTGAPCRSERLAKYNQVSSMDTGLVIRRREGAAFLLCGPRELCGPRTLCSCLYLVLPACRSKRHGRCPDVSSKALGL